MRAVRQDVPGHLLAERRRLGLDRRDEVWEGVLRMVPPASEPHQRTVARLIEVLAAVRRPAGLRIAAEIGVFDPEAEGDSSYRVPDLTLYRPDAASERGVEGVAALVVAIRSPGDESLAKVAYYDRVGVAEVLVVERDHCSVRRWARAAGGPLAEAGPDADGWHRLDGLPVGVRGGDGRLEVRQPDGTIDPVAGPHAEL